MITGYSVHEYDINHMYMCITSYISNDSMLQLEGELDHY